MPRYGHHRARKQLITEDTKHTEGTEIMLQAHITKQVIGGFFDVYKEFGFGFLEGSYANALAVELRSKGLRVRREFPIEVVYRGVPVGTYRVDLVVEECVLVEVK
jgi:GxxExxY protein